MKIGSRMILCILTVTVLTSVCLFPASANSAVRYWEGSTAYGVVTGEGQCPVAVLHETLTFDIPHFPFSTYDAYAPKVIADYTLHNPSDADITLQLAFPFGQEPNYPNGFTDSFDKDAHRVSLNGQPVKMQLRNTYLWGQFDLLNDLPKLRDGYAKHDFYSFELPVTHYVYELRKNNVNQTAQAYAELLIKNDLGEKTKIFVPDSASPRDGDGVHIRVDVHRNTMQQILDVYVLGESLETLPEWKLGFHNDAKPFNAEFSLLSTTEMTYYDFAMLEYEENESVSERDWYNAVTDAFIQGERDFGVTSTYHSTLDMTGWLMQWYEYEITVPAGQTVQHTVTAPIFPSIDEGYEPTVYEYNYLLSPATTWASFGTLDVIINTPYYLVNDIYAYESFEGGYKKHFESLPSGELSFLLSTDEDPKSAGPNFAGMLLGFLAIIFGSFFIGVVAILIMIFIIVLILFVIIRAIVRRKRR